MTTLLVDIGNSRLKWTSLGAGGPARLHAPIPAPARALATRPRGLTERLTRAWSDLPTPDRVLVCNVAGRGIGKRLEAWLGAAWSIDPSYLRATAADHGVVNAYTEPGRLGADRWAALIATRHHHPGPCCIVDYGSAATWDLLGADGRHLGGRIAPGLGTMLRALYRDADTFGGAEAEPPRPAEVLLPAVPDSGTDTRACLAAGLLHALLAPTLAFLETARSRVDAPPALIVTGGDAPLLLPHLPAMTRHEPDLVLQGLAVVARQAARASVGGSVGH